jgi:hypothetical protein
MSIHEYISIFYQTHGLGMQHCLSDVSIQCFIVGLLYYVPDAPFA